MREGNRRGTLRALWIPPKVLNIYFIPNQPNPLHWAFFSSFNKFIACGATSEFLACKAIEICHFSSALGVLDLCGLVGVFFGAVVLGGLVNAFFGAVQLK